MLVLEQSRKFIVAEKNCTDNGLSNETATNSTAKKTSNFDQHLKFHSPCEQATDKHFLLKIHCPLPVVPPQRYEDTYSLHGWHPTSSPTCRKCWNAAWRLVSSSISQPANNHFSLSTPFVNSLTTFLWQRTLLRRFLRTMAPLGLRLPLKIDTVRHFLSSTMIFISAWLKVWEQVAHRYAIFLCSWNV